MTRKSQRKRKYPAQAAPLTERPPSIDRTLLRALAKMLQQIAAEILRMTE